MKKKSVIAVRFVLILYMCFVSLIVLYPIVYVVSAAFSPGVSIVSLDTIPFKNGISLSHFEKLISNTQYLQWFLNTLKVSAVTSIFTVAIAALSAYVFSRFSFPLKKKMLTGMLVLQIFPSFLGMSAVYVILLRIGCIDTLQGLSLVYIAGNIPYSTWLVKSYTDTISRSLDEAARMDGASNFRIFIQIILPVIKPVLIFLMVTSFTMPWMDFIFPKLILRSPEHKTLAIGLYSFVTDKKNEFTLFAAGALPVAIPFIVFFTAARNMMMTSLSGAAVKE